VKLNLHAEPATLRRVVVLVCMLVIGAQILVCGSLNVGFLSFDVFIPPAPGAPGTNAFNIVNLTDGSALPPDFPALTALTFLNGSLTLASGGSPSLVPLGDIGPGNTTPILALEFPDTSSFSSALFMATLSTTTIALSDGTTFVADSPSITATMVPSSGGSLTAGVDSVVLSVSGNLVSVPEPNPRGVLLFAGIAMLVAIARRRKGAWREPVR
jgi:hypothetical protein